MGGLQALEATDTAGTASKFPACVQFKWGNCVKAPELASLSAGGVSLDIAHFLASFFAKHDGKVLISGHSEGVAYALLLFRALQDAAEGKYSNKQEVMEQSSPEAVFSKKLVRLARGSNAEETLCRWAGNAHALITGPFGVAFDKEWAEYFLIRHQSQVAAVVSSVSVKAKPDGSGAWERNFEHVTNEQRKLVKVLGRIPDLMYGFSYGEGRCLADSRVKEIFELYAFLLEARLSDTDTEASHSADHQGRVLYSGLSFLKDLGPSFKWSFEPDYLSPGKKAGVTWELHQLGAYRRIAKLLPVTLFSKPAKGRRLAPFTALL